LILKKILKKYFANLAFFYQFLGYRVFLAFVISVAVGILDGLGLSMFLPLLQMVSDGEVLNNIQGMGKLDFIINGIRKLGIKITLVSVLIIMFFFFLFKGFAKYFSVYYRVKVQQYFIKRVRIKMLNSFNRIKFKEFISADVGRIQNAMTGEIDKLARAFSMYFATFEQVILVFVYAGFAVIVELRFAILVTIGGILTNFIYNYFYKLTKISSKRLSNKSNIYQGQIIQHVGNFKYLRATATTQVYADKLKETIIQLEKTRTQIGIYGAFLQAAREPMMIGIVVIIIFVQVYFLGSNLGPILISLLFFYRALSALTSMQTNWNKFLENSGSLENVKTFQQILSDSSETTGTIEIEKLFNNIELEKISFCYGNKKVLRDISLTIKKNESIGFVGESGSGKTTLINVLAGLMPVDGGKMYVDGIDRNDLNIISYQKRIGYVTQEPVIFNDTIFNNITFWAEPTQPNLQRFEEVISRASLSDFINQLPERYDALLGNNGINISGGQKQRISIARELYKDIDVLVLDEATSALDTETERAIQESIDLLKGTLTLLIVAHRLSTVRNVDRIALLSNGELVDIDNFENLKVKNSVFKGMVQLQEISN
jgi:ABC-type multidrug transport system fused ATPase/permease subunit